METVGSFDFFLDKEADAFSSLSDSETVRVTLNGLVAYCNRDVLMGEHSISQMYGNLWYVCSCSILGSTSLRSITN